MKHLLYGTTALVAAGLLAAGPARAAEQPIQITIGGYFYAFFEWEQNHGGAVDVVQGVLQPGNVLNGSVGTASTLANHGIKDKSRIQFDGRTQLDNGLVAGLRVQLRGNNSDSMVIGSSVTGASVKGSSSEDQVDDHFMFLDSATYGRMEAGATASAPRKMWYGAVTPAMPAHGMMSPNFIEFAGGQAGLAISQPTTLVTMSGQTDRADKVSYYTPRIVGFQLGVSYAPDECQANDAGSATGTQGITAAQCHFLGANTPHNLLNAQKNIWGGAVNYVNKFGDFDVGIMVGIEHGTLEAQLPGIAGTTIQNHRDQTQIDGGFRVGWMGWSLGFSARTDNQGEKGGNLIANNNVGFAPGRRNDYHGGLSYGQGPWSIGASIAYADQQEKNGAGQSPNTVLGSPFSSHDKLLGEALGANYALGPGVNINAAVEHLDVSAAASGNVILSPTNTISGTNSNHAWLYTIGTVLNF